MNREDLVLGCKVVCNGYLKKTKMKYCLPKLDIEDYEPEQLKVISNVGNSEGIKYLKLVAKVYFKKGQSRLVPLEMVELIND